jgi:hypothetical protein
MPTWVERPVSELTKIGSNAVCGSIAARPLMTKKVNYSQPGLAWRSKTMGPSMNCASPSGSVPNQIDKGRNYSRHLVRLGGEPPGGHREAVENTPANGVHR